MSADLHSPVHPFAQTNLQLMNQVRRDGYSPENISHLQRCYTTAMSLFSGQFRPSGKTFLAHLLGTASIVAWLKVDMDIVAAALLHAAYTHGDFGDGQSGMTQSRMLWMRKSAGDAVEHLVARYTEFKWSIDNVQVLLHQILTPDDRMVVLIRLANELEDYLDLGVLYCGEERRRQADDARSASEVLRQIADTLGYRDLGSEIVRAFEQVARSEVRSGLGGPAAPNRSFLVVPPSYLRVMEAVTRRLGQQ